MLCEPIFALEHSSHGPYTIVRATGELDIAAVLALRDAVHRAARRGPRVVVDLRRVTFMDTFALRALLALQRDAFAEQDSSLHVVPGGHRSVQRLLDVAGARDALRWMSSEQLAG